MNLPRDLFPFLYFDDPVPLPGSRSWTAAPTFWDLYRTGTLYFTVRLTDADGSVRELRDFGISAPDGDADVDWSDAVRPGVRNSLGLGLRQHLGIDGRDRPRASES